MPSPTRLPDGTYYWGVTPIDAQSHDGTPSDVYSFTYSWPNDTTLSLNDLDSRPEVFDPQFSWTAIPGAAYYKVDVNTDPNFPSGSNVCCSGKTVATSLTPGDAPAGGAAYYWRVTPYDSTGVNAGTPTVYSDVNDDPQTFTITYDGGLAAVANLSMRDSANGVLDWPGDATGVSTDTPIVSWDPVPGAASYEVQVSPYSAGICDWATKPWDVHTASTSWTPLGSGHAIADPWPNPRSLATDLTALVVGKAYCVRVRAERNQDTANHLVVGSWTDIGDDVHPSFTFTQFPAGERVQRLLRRIPGLGRLRPARDRDRVAGHAALHVGADLRLPELLRRRRDRQPVPERGRLRVDAGAGVCAAGGPERVHRLQRRDLLLGGASGDRVHRDGRLGPARPRADGDVPAPVRRADPHLAEQRRPDLHLAGLPVDAGRRRLRLPPPGRDRPELLEHPHGR